MRNFSLRLFLFIATTLLCSVEAWGGQAYVYAYADPQEGGYVYVNTTQSAPSTYSMSQHSNSQGGFMSSGDKTFYLYYKAQPGYEFKGWYKNSSKNTATTTNSTSNTTNGWKVTQTATGIGEQASYYNAIFATLQGSLSSTFPDTKVGGLSTRTLTIKHAHAGTVSISISGANASEYTLSKTSFTSTTAGTQDVTITFKPTCNGTRTATLTITSDNGLSSVEISLSAVAQLNAQTLSWTNESSIETDMLLGDNQVVQATATSGLTVAYSSNNSSVLSVDASGKLSALALGEAVITASQAGDCKYSSASITKTFHVKTKDTPFFTPSGFSEGSTCYLKVGDKVTLQVANVSAGLSGDFKATATGLSILDISRDGNTITIEALNEGNSTASFVQTENATIFGATKTYNFSVSKIPNTLAADDAHVMYVEGEWSSVATGKNSDGVVTTSSSDATVAYYDVANNKIVAPNSSAQSFDSKDVTIVINQAATYKYTAASETIQVTVKKHENPLTVNGSATYATTLPYDNGQYLTIASANNATRPAFVVNQTVGDDKATYYENAGSPYVWTSIYAGAAAWTVDQAEDYKFKAGHATFSVTVAPAAEPTGCYEVLDDNEFSLSFSLLWQEVEKEFTLPGKCTTVFFEAKREKAAAVGNLVLQQYVDGAWMATSYDENPATSYESSGRIALDENATKIRFYNGYGSYKRYIRNVRVTRKTYLNADDLTIDEKSAGNAIYPGETGSNTLTIDWSLAGGGDLKIVNDNSAEFTLSQTTISDVDCAAGTTNITVQYKESDNQAGSSEAHLVIYNDVYRKEVTLTGITVKRDQAPVWNIDPVITLASEWTNVFESALSSLGVTYTFTPATGILELQGDKIVAVGAGDVTIHAHVDGNSEYNPIDADKAISVTTDQVQYISWDQNLMNLRWGEDDDIVLTATAQSDVVGCTTNGLRSVTYTSSDESVVRVEAGVLKVLAPGTATLTASVAAGTDADGHTYIAASTEKKVVVRDPSAPCEAFVYQQPSEYRFELGWNLANKQTKTQEINLGGLEPGYYSFDYKGESKSVGFEYYDGTMTVEQYYDGAWHEVQNLGKPTKSSYRHTGDVALDRRATSIRVKVTSGLGYQYFNNMEITLARYIETSQDNIIFNSIIGENPSRTITIDYSNITDNVAISFVEPNAPFVLDKTSISGSCGDHDKNVPLTITYVPARPESDQTYTLRITDGTTTHDVLINATATLNEFIFEGTNLSDPTDWQTADNWNNNDLPTLNDRVIIRSDVVLDTPLAAYEMLIENDATVTIAPTGGLSIGLGGVTGATADNFIIQSDASHTGFFRMNPEAGAMPQATVEFYSKGANAGCEHDAVWQYFGVPVTNKGDGTLGSKKEHFFGSYVYLWNEQQGWQQKFSNSSLTPFEGYAITQNTATTYTLKGQLLNPNKDVVLTKTPAGMDGDNVFANSYAAPIDVRTFTAEDFEGGAEMTFYLYNSGSWNQWQNAGSLEGSTPGQYTAIPVLASPALDPAHDVVTIAPMEGVYVQATAAGVIHLNYDKHVWRAKPDMPTNNPRHLRRAGAVETPEAQEEEPLFVLDRRVRLEVVAEDGSSDRIYLLQSETFSPAYDNGFDAPKVFSDGLLGFYANSADGQMSVASTDDILGLQLGFHAGDAANYTLRVTSVLGEEVALRDQLTNEVVLLEDGATYAFSAPAHSQNAQRFEVVDAALYWESQMHQEGVATSLEQLTSAAEGTMLAVYDAAGRLITTVPYAGSLMHSVQALPAGVYMVQTADKVLKIVK